MTEPAIPTFQWIVVSGLWLIFFSSLWRAFRRGKLIDPAARYIWVLFFLWMISFSLWGIAAEQQINQRFGGQPIALYLKCACMIVTFHGYYIVLKPMHPTAWRHGIGDRLLPLALVLGLLSYGLYREQWIRSYEVLRYLVIGMREAIMGIFAVLIFIPYTHQMRRAETHPPLKIKQAAALLCFVCYTISAVGGITAGILTALSLPGAERVVQGFNIAIYTGLIPFAVTLMPYRWLALIAHLQRYLLYRRLKYIEFQLKRGTEYRMEPAASLVTLRRTEALELAIYQTAIFIMDFLQTTRATHLYPVVQPVITDQQEFDTLVEALSRIRIQ